MENYLHTISARATTKPCEELGKRLAKLEISDLPCEETRLIEMIQDLK